MSEQTLNNICNGFRARLRAMLVEYGALQLLFAVLALALALMALDWNFRFSSDLRLGSLLLLLATAGVCGFFGICRPLRRRWNDDEVLGYIDRVSPLGGDALTTLRDLGHPESMREYDTEQGKALVRAVSGELADVAARLDVERTLRRRPLVVWRRLAGAILLVYAFGCIVPRDRLSRSSYLAIGLKRILLPYADIFWPQATRLFVQPPAGGWRVPRGEQLVVRARIDGVVPPIVNIVYRSESGDTWITERMAVNREAREAAFTFGEMMEPMTFYCMGGDDFEKKRHSVTVADRPRITGIKAIYTYPAYMRLPRKTISSGQISGPEGAEVRLEFTASADLRKATIALALEGENPQPPTEIPDLDGNRFSHMLRLARSGLYTIELTDRQNLENLRAERYEIRVEPDAPPEIAIEEPLGDMLLTANGRVRVKFKARDDHFLTDLDVMLATVGDKGHKLSDRITGPFWLAGATNSPSGQGDFYLDFPREKDKGTLKEFKIDQGVELELWIRARDINLSGRGVTESARVRLSVLTDTDFMDAIVLKARNLMNDARVGWLAGAGAYHDGTNWVRRTADDKLLAQVLEQQQTAEHSAEALKLRYQEIVRHMEHNRMQRLFMMKRFENIGAFINDVSVSWAACGRAIAAGQPTSSQEAQPEARRAKMARALQGVSADQKKAALRMKLLYDRLADWIALQSVLLKTRRIEELQTRLNAATETFVSRTLGREARELEDAETRQMREIGGLQQTVYEIANGVEMEIRQLTAEADKEGRRPVWEALMTAFRDLRDNRITDKLKLAAMNILGAKGDLARKDQKEALDVIAMVNRALIVAGEQVPENPPAALFALPLEDPRGKQEETVIAVDEGGAIDVEDVRGRERIALLDEGRADSLEDALDRVYRTQGDVLNRTQHVAHRGALSPRYAALRVGLTASRQGHVTNLLHRALGQVRGHGRPPPPAAGASPLPADDPLGNQARARAGSRLAECIVTAEMARRLLTEGSFSPLVLGLQAHTRQSARDVRVYLQQSERLHKLALDRRASNFKDPFNRVYLLNSDNFSSVTNAARDLEWGLVLQTAVQRESDLLARMLAEKDLSPSSRAAIERLRDASRRKTEELVTLLNRAHANISSGVTDSPDPERENEKILPAIREKIISPLDPKSYDGLLAQFDKQEYQALAVRHENLRVSLSSVLLSLGDIFETRVPPKVVQDEIDVGPPVDDSGDYFEYGDEQPAVLADRLEREGAWLDERTGDPAVRQALIKRLREIGRFDPRYARLQSAYFQALAQEFQARVRREADKRQPDDRKEATP